MGSDIVFWITKAYSPGPTLALDKLKAMGSTDDAIPSHSVYLSFEAKELKPSRPGGKRLTSRNLVQAMCIMEAQTGFSSAFGQGSSR